MKITRIVCCSCVLLVSLLAICLPASVLAQDEEDKIKELLERQIDIAPVYPALEAVAGEDFEFEVQFMYIGLMPRTFDLRTLAPQGWSVRMTPLWDKERSLTAISLAPAFTYGDKIWVIVSAPLSPLPEPGEYMITLEAVSGELGTTVELKAIITARYSLVIIPAAERYNTTAKAGRDNYFSIEVDNRGTAVIDNITFSSAKPTGWTIEFSPSKVDSMEAHDSQIIDVNIKPPPETITGDYAITLIASGKQATSSELDIRVTVETPTIWGWVGVAIILMVVVGLVVIVMRFSRR